MALRSYHVESPQFRHTLAQADIRPPSGHVGGYGNRAVLTGHGDDSGLFGVFDRVQQLVGQLDGGQTPGQVFACPDASRPYQKRPPQSV